MMQLALWDNDRPAGPSTSKRVNGRRFLHDRDSGRQVELVLASGSIARRTVLRQLGLGFIVDHLEIDEQAVLAGHQPAEGVRRLALAKALAMVCRHVGSVIVGADTVIVNGDRVIGKPATWKDAAQTLASLSGSSHAVLSGLAVVDTRSGQQESLHVLTTVHFKSLSGDEIQRYVRTREPMGKAGSYAIQRLGALLIERIDGDPQNVMGLPVGGLSEALDRLRIDVL